MTQAILDITKAEDQQQIREQLQRILLGAAFDQSPKMKELLSFVVEQTLQGQGDRLKQFTIATEVFDRGVDFDHQADPIVRIQAGRVRRALDTYYLTEGSQDPLLINIPKGRYSPNFTSRDLAAPTAKTEQSGQAPLQIDLQPRLTVLPFLSLSDDKEKQYFADGFSEELSAELSRFDAIQVVSMHALGESTIDPRTSADVRGLGEKLEVSFIASGTMQYLGDQVRIHAKLYRSDSGQQVWAEKFHCNLATQDLFATQDEIIAEIVAELASSFGIIHREIYMSSHNKSIEQLSTYEAILLYRHYLMSIDKASHNRALEALERAVEREPLQAMPLAMLAILYFDADLLGYAEINGALEKGLDCARKAAEMEPNNQQAQVALMLACQAIGDAEGVAEHACRVVELNPNAAFHVGLAGWVLCLSGEFAKGKPLLASSQKLNPFRPAWFTMAEVLEDLSADRIESAQKRMDQFSLQELFWYPLLKTILHVEQQEFMQAKASYTQLLKLKPDFAKKREHYIGAYIVDKHIRARFLKALDVLG